MSLSFYTFLKTVKFTELRKHDILNTTKQSVRFISVTRRNGNNTAKTI